MESLPSNFGAPAHFCDFRGDYPDQLWDQSRPHTPYKGQLFETGGSLPEAGKGPFSDFQNPCTGGGSNERFWSAAQHEHAGGPPNTLGG